MNISSVKHVLLFVIAFWAGGPGNAVSDQGHGASHVESREARADSADFVREYDEAMQRMHSAMMDGNTHIDADEAFVRGMIPHHQGAVDMSRIQLRHGGDPQLRSLAERIIRSQETEIKEMRDWLRKREARPADH